MSVEAGFSAKLHSHWMTPCFEKLDRLGWHHGFSFRNNGVTVGVRVSEPKLLPHLRLRLPPGSRRCDKDVLDCIFSVIAARQSDWPRTKVYNLAYANHHQLARSLDLNDVLDSLESSFRQWVAFLAPDRLFIHAGVVGWNNEAILLPGKSFSGKTSLVGDLVRAGATYYSDEFAVLDAEGRVHPFITPLGIRQDASGRQVKTSVAEIGGRSATRPAPIGLVVLSEFKPGARWQPEYLSPGGGVLALLSHTVAARRVPEKAFAILERVVARASIVKSRRGEASGAARNILEVMDRQTRHLVSGTG